MNRPEIICICGSTRFADLYAIKKWEFERTGKAICLTISYVPDYYIDELGLNKPDHIGEATNCKELLDKLHLRKIDIADKVYVINPKGYIGNSTRREINYATMHGKPIEYMEDHYAAEILYKRYIEGDPERKASVQEEINQIELSKISWLLRRHREAAFVTCPKDCWCWDIEAAIRDHAIMLVCNHCGRIEYPPYDVGDSCYDGCGGTFHSV